MAATWPVGLPQCFLADSVSAGFGDGRLRSQMDAGPAKVRRRTSAAVEPLSGQMVMTYAQLTALETFVKTTLLGGSLAFNFPSQRGGSAVLARFGQDLPTWQRHGMGKVMVSLALEVLP